MDDYTTDELIKQLTRIANVQEALLKLAMDARQEKKDLAAQMKEVFRRPPEIPGAPL